MKHGIVAAFVAGVDIVGVCNCGEIFTVSVYSTYSDGTPADHLSNAMKQHISEQR